MCLYSPLGDLSGIEAMSDAICSLYTRWNHENFNVDQLESVMSRFGASLYFPGTKDVIALTDEGEQRRYDRATFAGKARLQESTSFQWWINECEDIYCRLRWVKSNCVVEFGLDGIDELQVRQFVVPSSIMRRKSQMEGVFLGC